MTSNTRKMPGDMLRYYIAHNHIDWITNMTSVALSDLRNCILSLDKNIGNIKCVFCDPTSICGLPLDADDCVAVVIRQCCDTTALGVQMRTGTPSGR